MLRLPDTAPENGQMLITDAAGNLRWIWLCKEDTASTSERTEADLNAAYPEITHPTGFELFCTAILSGSTVIYKRSGTQWYRSTATIVI